MKEFILNKNLWLLDLVTSVVFSAVISYTFQYGADSGQLRPEKLVPATTVGGASYLLAYIIACLFRNRFLTVPSWVWLGVGGSLILVLACGLMSILIGRSFPFVTHVVAIVVLVVPFLLTIRTIAYTFRTAFPRKRAN